MKIISNFKDYYDHQAHIYGGADPKIVYVRRPLTELKKDVNEGVRWQTKNYPYFENYSQNLVLTISENWERLESDFVFKDKVYERGANSWLIVCGKAYPLINLSDTYEPQYEIVDKVKHSAYIKNIRHSFHAPTPVGVETPQLVELSRNIGVPAFIIESSRWVQVNKKSYLEMTIQNKPPVLADLGLASIYEASQLYQDLAYFVTNRLQSSPDTSPAIKQDNKEKITQHGFDLKQSFRHRV